MCARTRLFETGATWYNLVSRIFRSICMSRAIPYPPWTSIATFAARQEHSDARYFAMFACSPTSFGSASASYRAVACHRTRSAATRRACASARGNWMPWLLPIARPKTTRPFAYSTDRSMNQRESPMHSVALRIRSGLRTWRRGSNPWPSLGQARKDLAADPLGGKARHEEGKVELPVKGLGVAAPRVDLLEEEGRVGQRAARAAVFRRNEETSETLGLELRDERLRIRLGVLEALPVVRRKAIHQARDGGQHDPLGLIRHERHATSPPSCGP